VEPAAVRPEHDDHTENALAHWLLKTEPGCYSWSDLVRDRRTSWDGVTNALALKHIRSMKKGDLALVYHTGDERAAVGIAEITSNPRPDEKADSDKAVLVDLKPREPLKQPVSLSDIKADPAFAGWDLIRNSRLSVMPVPERMWKRIEQLAASD
jgi:predicted RNA-binding protein with PUA-like domain